MPRIPQDHTPKGGKRELIKARYIMKVLRSIKGKIIDAKHPDYRWEQNIGLYDKVSPVSMKKVERSGQTTVRGKTVMESLLWILPPLCLYASQNRWTLNNHVQLHFHVTMACRMKDYWYVSQSAESMWKQAASHGLHTAEPIAVNPKKK